LKNKYKNKFVIEKIMIRYSVAHNNSSQGDVICENFTLPQNRKPKQNYSNYPQVNDISSSGILSTNYTVPPPDVPLDQWRTIPKPNDLLIQNKSQYRFIQERSTGSDNSFYSTNEALHGPANPKTLVAPLVIAPSHAWDYWSEDFIVPSNINNETHEELYQSGYLTNTLCGQTQGLMNVHSESIGPLPHREYPRPINSIDDLVRGGENIGGYTIANTMGVVGDLNVYGEDCTSCGYNDTNASDVAMCNQNPSQQSGNQLKKRNQVTFGVEGSGEYSTNDYTTNNYNESNQRENFQTTQTSKHVHQNGYKPENLIKSKGDMVDFSYNPEQMLKHNLPSNYPSGQCSQGDVFNEYNKNLYTQTITPGTYARSEIIEPISSNLGITYTQQFEPVTCQNDNGGVTYISHDPRVQPISDIAPPRRVDPENSNVYDPRYTGYGTSYRSYVDDMTGQTRFYYDDVDAIRRPNMICRSNIDNFSWAHKYGPMDGEKENGPIPNSFSHSLANNQFLRDSTNQREELQERLMRKINIDGWQQRQFPLQKGTGGGVNRCIR
jgi:hypothetical protein